MIGPAGQVAKGGVVDLIFWPVLAPSFYSWKRGFLPATSPLAIHGPSPEPHFPYQASLSPSSHKLQILLLHLLLQFIYLGFKSFTYTNLFSQSSANTHFTQRNR